jgi:hypothetical protein
MKIVDFKKLGIPVEYPGFYNHESFLKKEQENPAFLNEYCRYVYSKTYSEEYLENAKKKIVLVSNILFDELQKDGRKGACIDICQALSKILERENIWCCMISGSMTIKFSPVLGIEKKYFWAIDTGNFSAPHTWLFAPPFKVVDIALSLQHYSSNESSYLPDYIREEKTSKATLKPIDLINPAIIPNGLTIEQIFSKTVTNDPIASAFMSDIQPFKIEQENCSISYFPIRANASDGELEELKAIDFSGKSALNVYKDIILPELSKIRT